jgi:hypothetical protein
MLTADDRFCPTCGQKSDTHRLTMAHIWHDLVHAFTHADKGFLFTLKELAIRPGTVAREYIQGKRKKYFNPFSFLIIVVGITLLANSVFKPYEMGEAEYKRTTEQFKGSSKQQKVIEIMERRKKMGEFMNKHTNVVLFVSTPFLAFIMWMLFRRRKIYYAEQVAVIAYSNGFLNVLLVVLFGPLLFLTKGTIANSYIYFAMMLSHVLYLGFMYHGFIGYTRKDYWRSIGVGIIAILAWAIFSMTIGFLYISWGILF